MLKHSEPVRGKKIFNSRIFSGTGAIPTASANQRLTRPPKAPEMNNNTRSTERTDNEFGDSKSEYEKKFEDEVQKRRLKTMNSAANPTEEEITACICNRRPQSVFCGICGEFFPLQRIRKQCTVHPKLLFAKDIEMCCQCKCEDPSFFYEIDPN